MADDKNKQSASFSLQNEIKKRRTQEIQRAIENNKIAQARGEDPRRASQQVPSVPAPDPRRASQQIQSLDPRRASQTTQAADPRRASQQIQSLDPRRASQQTTAVDQRRASQTANAVDPRRASQQTAAADPRRASQQMKVADPRRTSQTMNAVDSRRSSQTMNAVDAQRASQTMTFRVSGLQKRRQTMIIAIAALSIVAVCMITLMVAMKQPVEAKTMPAIPPKSVGQAVQYLQDAGVKLTIRELAVDPNTWSATEMREITASSGGQSQIFLLLGYKDRGLTIGDSMRGQITNNRFKDWTATVYGNLLLVIPPDYNKTIINEVDSHLTSFVIQKFSDGYLPTPTNTPDPNATPTIKPVNQ